MPAPLLSFLLACAWVHAETPFVKFEKAPEKGPAAEARCQYKPDGKPDLPEWPDKTNVAGIAGYLRPYALCADHERFLFSVCQKDGTCVAQMFPGGETRVLIDKDSMEHFLKFAMKRGLTKENFDFAVQSHNHPVAALNRPAAAGSMSWRRISGRDEDLPRPERALTGPSQSDVIASWGRSYLENVGLVDKDDERPRVVGMVVDAGGFFLFRGARKADYGGKPEGYDDKARDAARDELIRASQASGADGGAYAEKFIAHGGAVMRFVPVDQAARLDAEARELAR